MYKLYTPFLAHLNHPTLKVLFCQALNRHDIELIGIGSEFNDVFFLLSNAEQKKIIEAQRKIRQEKAKNR